MRKIILSLLVLIVTTKIQAQNINAELVANKIAQKMKDSLSLSEDQKIQVYNINLELSNQKMQIRQQYTGTDSLKIKIQSVENKRDSLYHTVLSDEKYYIYLTKKRNLVNNN